MNAETEEKYRKVGHALIHFIAQRVTGNIEDKAEVVAEIKAKALALVNENFTRDELQDYTATTILDVVIKTGNQALQIIQAAHA